MRVRVSDIDPDCVSAIVNKWLTSFSLCGKVIGFSLYGTQPSVIGSINEAWVRVLGCSDSFFVGSRRENPRLVSFWGQLSPEANSGSIPDFVGIISHAWNDANAVSTASAMDVYVVGEDLTVYGNPLVPNMGDCLADLAEILLWSKQSHAIGNLGHPSSDKDERLFEMYSPHIDVPLTERYVWESSLSLNSVELLFQAGPDALNRTTQMSSLLGRSWDNGLPEIAVEWAREVRSGSEVVGKEVLTLTGVSSQGRCVAAPDAAAFFGLDSRFAALRLIASTGEKAFLSGFAPSQRPVDLGKADSAFLWPLPDSPCFRNLLSLAVRFVAK